MSTPHQLKGFQIPEQLNAAAYLLDRNIELGRGSRPAVFEGDRSLTYQELNETVNRLGSFLQAQGVRRGEAVVIRMPMSIESLVTFLAAVKIGAVAIPTSIMLTAVELQRVVSDSKAAAVIVSEELVSAVREIRGQTDTVRLLIVDGQELSDGEIGFDACIQQGSAELTPVAMDKEEPFMVLYTSGSTSTPKAVVRAHRVIIAAGEVNSYALMQLTESDVCYHPHQDISFSYPLGHGLLFPLYAGAAAAICPARTEGRFDPEQVFVTLEKFKVTVLSAPVPVFRRMLEVPDAEHRYDLSSLRFITCAAEPLPLETFRAWETRFGLRLYETMGQTEVPSFVGFYPGVPQRPGALGKPFPGIKVTTVDDNGIEIPPGEVGYLAIDGAYPGLCSGYGNNPERWAQVCHHGWYYTQDLARRDEDGYIWYVSRADQVVKIQGYTVSPAEIESVLLEHPAVNDVAVVGTKDAKGRQALKAFVVLDPGVPRDQTTGDLLRTFARDRLVPYKVPHGWEFLDALPRTATGKVLRQALISE